MLSENVLSNNLKDLMIERRINQSALAEKSGVPQARISDILSGNTKNPQVNTVSKIAKALSVSVDRLLAQQTNITKQAS